MLQNNDLDWDEIKRQYNDVYGEIYSTRDKPNQEVALLALNFIHQYPQKEIPQLMLNYIADALAEDAVIGLCELLDYQYEYALRKGHYTSGYLSNPLYTIRALRKASKNGGANADRLIATLIRAMALPGLTRQELHPYFQDIGTQALPQIRFAIEHPEQIWTLKLWGKDDWFESRIIYQTSIPPIEGLKLVITQIESEKD